MSDLSLSGDKSITKVLLSKSTHTRLSQKTSTQQLQRKDSVCVSVPVEATCSVTDAESCLGLEDTHTHRETWSPKTTLFMFACVWNTTKSMVVLFSILKDAETDVRKSRRLYSKREHIKTVESQGNLRWARVIRLMHRLYYELRTISAAFEPQSHYRTCAVSKPPQHLPLDKERDDI